MNIVAVFVPYFGTSRVSLHVLEGPGQLALKVEL